MYLELAESGHRPIKGLLQEKRSVNVSGYRRRANNVPRHKRTLSEDENPNPYIFVPDATGGGKWVREDMFDSLDSLEWRKLMYELAPYQPGVNTGQLSESQFMSDRATRKAKREDKKTGRKTAKTAKKTGKEEKKKEKRTARTENIKNIMGGITGAVKNIFGKGDAESEATGGTSPLPEPDEEIKKTFLQQYQTPLLIGGGLALAGGIYYFATRK